MVARDRTCGDNRVRVLIDACPLCQSPRIPGIVACANCGEPFTAADITFDLASIEVPDDPLPDYYPQRTTDWQGINRALSEAHGLELAGDVDSAVAIYERLAASRTNVNVPYQRLAIIYRKLKRPADEERAVRLGLAHTVSRPGSWFVMRLAKILAEQRKKRERM